MAQDVRREHDFLGGEDIPADALWGIHTRRACRNFPLSGRRVHPALIHAYGWVKLAAAQRNHALGAWQDDPAKAKAIFQACQEMADGILDASVLVDALQGGAGTSTNMNVNEVLANRALQIMGAPLGSYDVVSPLGDINLHQSTNDTYPTALRLGAISLLRVLEENLVALQKAFQEKEKAFAAVVKIGRTEMQDAVPVTLGREMAAYAEAISRDRWRVYKCEERLRVVNLGGTAVGTGMAAPRAYIFGVVETLRELTGIGFARAENLMECTQNADVFVEVSGIVRACAASLIKIANDLRFMSASSVREISLPPVQAGSSIMPAKVNPVIPEAVIQAAVRMMGYDLQIATAAGMGHLELNPFMPLIADSLLCGLAEMANAVDILARLCVDGIAVNEDRCLAGVDSPTVHLTALVPVLGYEKAATVARKARDAGVSVKDAVVALGFMEPAAFDALVSSEALLRLGSF